MKLVQRVSWFFLAALAVVLVSYSAIFYVVVRGRLTRQFEQEMHGAFNSLVAAIEVEAEEVKWQPLEHTIALRAAPGPEPLEWIVIGDRKQVVEQSAVVSPPVAELAHAAAAHAGANAELLTQGEWIWLQRRLVAPAPDRTLREIDEFDEITVVVARSTKPLHADLDRLLLLVAALPVAAWLAAFAGGRWLVGRALQPVLDMARRARGMSGADFQARLPVSGAGDELTGLAVAFNTLLDRQQRAYEQQQRFAADAAHELRTPLTVLLGQIDVSLRRARTPQQYADTLGVLRQQTVDLQNIVESLLFLARHEEHAALPDAETLRLDEWLPRYVSRWNDPARRVEFHRSAELSTPCAVSASPALLTRLLDNLIENAFKYSPPGAPVAVMLSESDAEPRVTVADQGHGVAQAELSAIFEPFFRAQAARDANIGGVGLGLAIVARIAAALGGRVECTSELGHGSRFTLVLPRIGAMSKER